MLKDKVFSPAFPVVVVVIIAYLLASIFLSIFSFSATTILHCFIIDEEVKGNRAPQSLMSFIERNNAHNQKLAGKQKVNDGKKADEGAKAEIKEVAATEKKANNMA